MEKWQKYQPLAADLANQWKEEQVRVRVRVAVVPVVFGDFGLVRGLRANLEKSGVLAPEEINHFMRNAQRDVLCSAVRMIKRHLSLE